MCVIRYSVFRSFLPFHNLHSLIHMQTPTEIAESRSMNPVQPSPHRDRPIEQSLTIFRDMKEGLWKEAFLPPPSPFLLSLSLSLPLPHSSSNTSNIGDSYASDEDGLDERQSLHVGSRGVSHQTHSPAPNHWQQVVRILPPLSLSSPRLTSPHLASPPLRPLPHPIPWCYSA